MNEPPLRRMDLRRSLRRLLSRVTRSKGAIRARGIIHRIGIRLSIFCEYRASLESDRTLIQPRSSSWEIRICVFERAAISPIKGSTEVCRTDQSAPGNTVRMSALVNDEEIGHAYISFGKTYVPEIDRVVIPNGGYVWDLVVSPEYRRCGVGKAILREGMAFAANRLSYGSIHALVEKDNYCSRELFESMKFKQASLVFMLKVPGFSRSGRLSGSSSPNKNLRIE